MGDTNASQLRAERDAAPEDRVGDADTASVPRRSVADGDHLGRFLRTAVTSAETLHREHAQGHTLGAMSPKDLRADESGTVRLFPGRQLPGRGHGDAYADLVPYLSPEASGSVGPGLDARSDLYSFGMVLYEALTGTLPFHASDPLSWSHAHRARRPAPPSERVGDVPALLDTILLKLLRKHPDDRYQTARGLAHDLRRALGAWESTGHLQPFPLGEADETDRVRFLDRIYGREAEVAALAEALERVSVEGGTGFVFVSGYSGIGKSTLVSELRRTLVSAPSRFGTGKFDPLARGLPFAVLAQALDGVARFMLGRPEDDLRHWRSELRTDLGPDARLLTDLMPSLRSVLGRQDALGDLAPQNARARFHHLLRRLLTRLAGPGRPLILFLDDLQWADVATLDFLADLAEVDGIDHLLVIGAFRDNEVGREHPVTAVTERARAAGRLLHHLRLQPLSRGTVARMVSDALRVDAGEIGPIADVLDRKAAGNPFFAKRLFRRLIDDGLLRRDGAGRSWTLDVTREQSALPQDNVADLLASQLETLPNAAQEQLGWLSCAGSSATTSLLAQLLGKTDEEVPAALESLVAAEYLRPIAGGYAFTHDRIREAAETLVPDEQRASRHRAIAHALLGRRTPADVGADIFAITDHVNRAAGIAADDHERSLVLALNRNAADAARRAGAFVAAAEYLRAARVQADGVRSDAALLFDLDYHLAECEFLTGDTGSAEARVTDLRARGSGLGDAARVAWLDVTLRTALGDLPGAVTAGLAFLRQAGIDWPAHPTPDLVAQEFSSIMGEIARGAVERRTSLPILADEGLAGVLDVLAALLPPAFFTDDRLVCLALGRMANIAASHGHSPASPLGYAYLGMVLGPHFGHYDAARAFGRLGLDLVERPGLDRFRARVTMAYAAHVAPWVEPLGEARPLLRSALDLATRTGDLTYAGFSSCCYVTNMLAAGDPLADVGLEARERLSFVQGRFGLIADIVAVQLGLVAALRGETATPLSMTRAAFSETEFEARVVGNPSTRIVECWYWIRKLQLAVVAGDDAAARGFAERAAPLLWTTAGHLEFAEYHFYAGLAFTLSANGEDRERGRESRTWLSDWARVQPGTYGARAALLEAVSTGSDGQVVASFESAARLARESGQSHVEALAWDLAGQVCDARAAPVAAQAYKALAREAYARWGATTKASFLTPVALVEELTTSPSRPAVPVDLDTILRASQAISRETTLGGVVSTLMEIALKSAGAERAALIRPKQDRLWIEADAFVGREGAIHLSAEPRPAGHDTPEDLVRYCLRSREIVLLEDASDLHDFSADPYFQRRAHRSVLCIPLVRQAESVGALYLENDLAAGSFELTHVSLLQVIAAQAAISLENASLDEKEALLKEVHHRVKNNLQLVSSLLNLQASKLGQGAGFDALVESRNRVHSMALVHENLYRAGNFARIPMSPHMRSLCAHLVRVYGQEHALVRVVTEIDDLELDVDRATSGGLIVSELVANAFKHAFPDDREGTIRVTLSRLNGIEVELAVSDDGVGADLGSVREGDTLGLQLVSDLTAQLRGTLKSETSGGTRVSVRFPAITVEPS